MKRLILCTAAAILFANFSASAFNSRTHYEKDKVERSDGKHKKNRKRKANANEEDVVLNALKKIFNSSNYKISGLSLSESEGKKTLSGTVSFFNNDGVNLECQLTADNKLKSVSATFPSSATFRINHLDRLSSGEFRSLLPPSFSNSGITIKDFIIHFDGVDNNLESFETNLAAADWDFLSFKEFKMNSLTLKLELFKSQSKIGGELAGEVMLGSLKTKLSATMVPDKSIVFTGTIPGGQGKINVKDALYSVAGREDTDRFFGLIPGDIFNALAMPELALVAIPGDKKISLASQTDLGSVEMSVEKRGTNKDIRLALQAKDLSKIIQSDILKDVNLANPLVLISSTKQRGATIPSGQDNILVDLEEGMNVLTALQPSDQIKQLFKQEQFNFSGSIDKAKRIKLSAKLDMDDLPIGDTGVKFAGVGFGLESSPLPKFLVNGTLLIPVPDHEPLRFSAGLKTSPVPFALGGTLELITEGGDGVWRNPFGVPGVGVKNLGGSLLMMPAPPFLGEVALEGELLLGKDLTPAGNPIQGSLNMTLTLLNPINSSFEASVKNLTVAGMINAFSDTPLSGEVANLLRSGIDNATIKINPKETEVMASGDFQLLGKSAQIKIDFTPNRFAASGSMDPWEIKSGNFTVFSVKGAGGNTRPGFNLEISADPKFSLNGAVTALETMKGSAFIEITKTGFVADLSGDIFNGAFQGQLHAYGRNLSTNPIIHAELDLSQRVVNDFKISLKNFITKQAGNSEKDILAVRNKVNTGAKFLDDTFKGSLNAVNDLQNLSATAGVFLVDNLVPDVTRISFKGDLNSVSTKINVRVDYRAAGKQMPPVTITMDLKNPNYQNELDKMAEQMGMEVLHAFENLGEEVKTLAEGGKELLVDLGKGVVTAGKEVGKVANDVVGELDRFWNGENFEPVRTGPELTELSTTTRHYSVWIRSVTALTAEDDPLQGKVSSGIGQAADAVGNLFTGGNSNAAQQAMTITDNKIEVYGAILIVSNHSMRVSDPNTTNSYAWSRNRTSAVGNITTGYGFTVDSSPKHYYAQNGTPHSITIRSSLKEADEGERYDSDGSFAGQAVIQLGSWNWNTGQRLDDSFTATTNDGGKVSTLKIDYSIVLEPKISITQIRNAVASRNIESVRRLLLKGGDITEGSVLAPAIQNKDMAMINFLLASGALMQSQDIATALQPQTFSPEIATKIIVRSTAPLTTDDLNKAIALDNKNVVNLILSRSVAPTPQQLQTALSQNKLEIADALLANKAQATEADLTNAVNAMNVPTAQLLIKYGVNPNIGMLNQALQANNKAMANLILQNQKPDQSSYQIAADKNDLELFKLVSNKGVLLESDGPGQKAIDLNNMELLKQTIISGANPTNALNYAVQKQNMAAINLCLDYDGNPNLVVDYAAAKNDAALFTKLINDYKANGTTALGAAIAANNLSLAKIALEQGGANPDNDLKTQADKGNEAMVQLLVEYNGNPDLAMDGTIANQKVALLDFLIKSGANPVKPGYVTKAAELQSLDMTKLLVDNGANPDPGMPIAVASNNYDMTSYLLSAGANVNGFMAAPAEAGNLRMVKILLDNGAAPDEGMPNAVKASQLEIAKTLLSYGASPRGHLPQPSQNGNVEMIKLLLEYGADPNEGIKQAVDANKTEAAVLLLEAGASVKGLMATTAGLGNKTIVEMLLARGVNPTEGVRPAVQNNFTDVSILLLENGASIEGLMPLAAGNGNEAIVGKLLALGASADEGTKPAVTNKHTAVVRQLITAGAIVESSEFMLIAVRNLQEDMVRLLYENKCDITYKDANGNTFLHMVSGDDGEVGLVNAFIEFGLDVDQPNNEGNTSLHLAAESGKDNLEVVEAIVEAGADVNAVNKKGETPRKAAKGRRVKKYLKDNGGARKIKKK